MSLAVAVQMDPIAAIDISGDSTFALMLEAQRRGHSLFHYHVNALAYREGKLFARGEDVVVRDEKGNHFTASESRRVDLSQYDVLHMRQDPPFDMAYITATHLLERIHPKTLVVNDPREVRNAPEKLYILDFARFMPPTMISRSAAELEDFRKEHGEVILKPLFGNGGAGIFRTHRDDQNFSSLLEMFFQMNREPIIAQKYLPAVRAGDKRIILVDGKVAGAVNRVPAAHDNRSNMHVGGRAEPTELTKREHEICEALGPDDRDQRDVPHRHSPGQALRRQ
jgi:glutathione synthase